MKRLAILAATAGLFSALAFAQTWNGTLVDVMCKGRDLASHTTKCAIGCAKSGYGVVLPNGQFMKFDETGNAKALTALKATKKEKDLKVKVEGKAEGDVIQVSSVDIL